MPCRSPAGKHDGNPARTAPSDFPDRNVPEWGAPEGIPITHWTEKLQFQATEAPEKTSFLHGGHLRNSWRQGEHTLRRGHTGPQIEGRAVVTVEGQGSARKWPALTASCNPKILSSLTYNHKLSGHTSTQTGFRLCANCLFSTYYMPGTVLGPRYTVSGTGDPTVPAPAGQGEERLQHQL